LRPLRPRSRSRVSSAWSGRASRCIAPGLYEKMINVISGYRTRNNQATRLKSCEDTLHCCQSEIPPFMVPRAWVRALSHFTFEAWRFLIWMSKVYVYKEAKTKAPRPSSYDKAVLQTTI
jgi:hypothetical protein